jgi:putative peptidoglycan lipid II flippase
VPPSIRSLARRFARPDTSVGAGILVSRLAGLLRVRLIARYFGQNSIAVDAFNAAFRIPNLLQNLFGEGALSGSFIPVHSALRARGDHEAAAHTARVFFALLSLAIAVLVLSASSRPLSS